MLDEHNTYLKPGKGRLAKLEGLRFSRLFVIKSAGRNSSGNKIWLCRCDCGKESLVATSGLLHGTTKSCGCLYKERIGDQSRTHGKSKTLTYRRWGDMIQRCRRDPRYDHISVCERWRHSFENFLADMGECPKGLSLDRRDNNKGYYPENCRWVTMKDQANNTSSNINISINGEKKTLAEWCYALSISYNTVRMRILKLGWPVEEALSIPVGSRHRSGLYKAMPTRY